MPDNSIAPVHTVGDTVVDPDGVAYVVIRVSGDEVMIAPAKTARWVESGAVRRYDR